MEYYCDDVLNTDFRHTGQRNIKVSFIMVPLKIFCNFNIYRYIRMVQVTLAVVLMHCHAEVEYTASCKLTDETYQYINVCTSGRETKSFFVVLIFC